MCNNYPKSVKDLFKKYNSDSDILNIIQKHRQKLIKLNDIILKILPHELHIWYKVINYRQNILVLEVSNASQKIRLYYELRTLIIKLRKHSLPSLVSIKIKINPYLFKTNTLKSVSKKYINTNLTKHTVKKISIKSAKIISNLANKSPEKLKYQLKQLIILSTK